MTVRYHSLIVVLDQDTRDDADRLIEAIKMMKGVIDVSGEEADSNSHMAQSRARYELGQQILDVIYPARVR